MTLEYTPSTDPSIDFNSNIPYYVQLIDVFKALIQGGLWKPGIKIPAELDLCDSY